MIDPSCPISVPKACSYLGVSLRRQPRGFTMIEVVVAVVIMALLASAAALSFTQPLRIAREHDAIETLRSFDESARQIAIRLGHPVHCSFDLSHSMLSREENGAVHYQVRLPHDCRLRQVRTAGRRVSEGDARIVYSDRGVSRTYAIRVSGPGFDRWLLVPGFGGECTLIQNKGQLDGIFATTATRNESQAEDNTPGDDVD
jgi:prepilin-type N-terminal cleavage/methylation domain-containing protein